ncbi:MAG: hypothetical protein L0229_05510 [Blastocatellia bacterium]|nr:hypothetical protein [Blastocatellia bacterium]
MGRSGKLQYSLLSAGLIVAAVLLIRFAVDFSKEISALLAAPFWLLVAGSLAAGGANVFRALKNTPPLSLTRTFQAILLAVIPPGFLASSLDCTGLSLEGCSSFCTFIKLLWVPLIAVACAAHFFTGKGWLLTAITAMAFVPLVPHCACYNVGNGWWIDLLGASPVCYVWGFVVSVISISALRAGARPWLSLAVSGTIIAGATAFFISHHYFQFPW